MLVPRSLSFLALALGLAQSLFAELPLPDATFYGRITTSDGVPVTSGAIKASVRRGAAVFEAAGSFKQADGAFWYIIKIPLETSIGAPGAGGTAAREGDLVERLILDGQPLELVMAPPALRAAQVTRIDAVSPPQGGIRIFRGDCSPDLTIDITDAVRILNFLFIEPEAPPCLEACDADGSGALDITDPIFLLAFLFLGGPPPVAPGPLCAPHPNPSALGCAQTNCTGA